VETFLLEPNLFGTYIALDRVFAGTMNTCLRLRPSGQAESSRRRHLAGSSEMGELGQRFAGILKNSARRAPTGATSKWRTRSISTIYHPAALKAFRVFKRAPEK
jgi:hypothetical protein